MIKSIRFKNFKVLRDCTLPLSQFTLIIGPNGSGKTTALEGIRAIVKGMAWDQVVTAGARDTRNDSIEIVQQWSPCQGEVAIGRSWSPDGQTEEILKPKNLNPELRIDLHTELGAARMYSLNPRALPEPVKLTEKLELGLDGAGLAVVLDRIRDHYPERFEELNAELHRWIPEFDRVLFDTVGEGMRAFRLRMTGMEHGIPAKDLSQGSLLALAILTVAYLPDPPPILGLEEPDRGLHPRLLRDVRDAMYRLAYPEQYGDKREPVQVIATTHSPYMVDLFRDHPEEIVIAQRVGDNVKFERLSDRPNVEEIIQDARLGDLWYTGVLGGVPAEP